MYKFRELDFPNGGKTLAIDFDNKSMDALSGFLEWETSDFPKDVTAALDNVLSGKSDYEEFNGNAYGIEIHKDKTQVLDNLAPDGMGNWCEIDTAELRKLVQIWIEEYDRFKRRQAKK